MHCAAGPIERQQGDADELLPMGRCTRATLLLVWSERGPGGPRHSRPGGERYTFLQALVMAIEKRIRPIAIGEML